MMVTDDDESDDEIDDESDDESDDEIDDGIDYDDDDVDDDYDDNPMILCYRAKKHTSERTIVPWTVIFNLKTSQKNMQN